LILAEMPPKLGLLCFKLLNILQRKKKKKKLRKNALKLTDFCKE